MYNNADMFVCKPTLGPRLLVLMPFFFFFFLVWIVRSIVKKKIFLPLDIYIKERERERIIPNLASTNKTDTMAGPGPWPLSFVMSFQQVDPLKSSPLLAAIRGNRFQNTRYNDIVKSAKEVFFH